MKKTKLIINFILLFSFSLSFINAQTNDINRLKLDRLETAFKIIDNSYLKYRYFNAGFSLVFGGLVTYRGVIVLNDNQATTSEKNTAYALLGLGSVRIVDGLYGFLFSTPIEKNLIKFRRLKDSQQKIEFGEMKIKKAAKREKLMRYIRAFLIGGSGVALASLAVIDYEKHKIQGYIGILMVGVSVYKLLSRSPEEKAWKYYINCEKKQQEKNRIVRMNFYFGPCFKSFSAGITFEF